MSSVISPHKSIEFCLKQMKEFNTKSLVVSKNNKLLGTISDGDVRKAILKKVNIKTNISKAYNSECFFIKEKDFNEDSIKQIMLKKKYDIIPVVSNDKKIVKIIKYNDIFKLNFFFRKLKNISVFIMAGGEGKRLLPLTSILPKPLMPIGNKTIIQSIIEKFLNHEINNYYISVGYKSNLIKAFFSDLEAKYKTHFIHEKEPLGTAGSLKFIKNKISKSFFVINCDTLLDLDYYDLYDSHIKNKNIITIVTASKEYNIPYGSCEIKKDGSLLKINEKPSYNLKVNTGLYVVNPSVLKFIPPKGIYNFDSLISECLKRKKRIGIYEIGENNWVDIGEIKEYKDFLIQNS